MRRPRISLPKGVLWLLCLLAAFYVVELIAGSAGRISIYAHLVLIPAAVWNGDIWRVFTYGLLPVGLLDLLMSGIMLAWLGWRVSGVWSAGELLAYCGLCAAGAGTCLAIIVPAASHAIGGPVVLVVSLAVAWARLFGHERVRLTPTFEITGFTLAAALGIAMLVLSIVMGGWVHAAVIIAAGLVGWIYLSLRWKANRSQPARAVDSGRINRLEL